MKKQSNQVEQGATANEVALTWPADRVRTQNYSNRSLGNLCCRLDTNLLFQSHLNACSNRHFGLTFSTVTRPDLSSKPYYYLIYMWHTYLWNLNGTCTSCSLISTGAWWIWYDASEEGVQVQVFFCFIFVVTTSDWSTVWRNFTKLHHSSGLSRCVCPFVCEMSSDMTVSPDCTHLMLCQPACLCLPSGLSMKINDPWVTIAFCTKWPQVSKNLMSILKDRTGKLKAPPWKNNPNGLKGILEKQQQNLTKKKKHLNLK